MGVTVLNVLNTCPVNTLRNHKISIISYGLHELFCSTGFLVGLKIFWNFGLESHQGGKREGRGSIYSKFYLCLRKLIISLPYYATFLQVPVPEIF